MDNIKEPVVPDIMPMDDDIELRQRQLKKTRGGASASRSEPASRAASSDNGSSGGSGVAMLAMILAVGACGFAGFLFTRLQDTSAQLADAQKVIEQQSQNLQVLNERLSVTGENATLSLDALKTMLKDQDAALDKVATSAARNKDMIAANDKDIAGLDSRLGKLDKVTADQSTLIDKTNQDLASQQDRLMNLEGAVQRIPAEMEIRMAQNTEAIQGNDAKLKALRDADTALRETDASLTRELSTLRNLITQTQARITALHSPGSR